MNASRRFHAKPVAFLACALATTPGAWAQDTGRPWYVGLTQDFTHQSNVLQLPTGEISDTISTTTLLGGVNANLGRQRLYANAALNHQRYSDLSERDNDGYVVGLGLDWQTIERLSGSLKFDSQRRQADFNVGGIVPASASNIERSDEVAFRARLGVVTQLGFDAGVGHRRVRFSAPEFAPREYNEDNGSVGLTYRPSGILGLSAGVSAARTRFLAPAVGQTDPDRSKRRDVYMGADWTPTGASTVNGRLAISKIEYDRGTAADFDGVTGALNWVWKPAARLAMTTSFTRDSGQESGFVRQDAATAVTATDLAQVTNRLGVKAEYELTGKVGVTGEAFASRRTLVDGFTGVTGRDRLTGLQLGVRWAVTRTIALGCNAAHETRSASGVGSTDYDNDRVGCFGSVLLD